MADKLREALNAVQQAAADLQKEIDRLAEIKATIRVNALRGGATTDEAEAMVEAIRDGCKGHGWLPEELPRDIAEALLAAGWTRKREAHR